MALAEIIRRGGGAAGVREGYLGGVAVQGVYCFEGGLLFGPCGSSCWGRGGGRLGGRCSQVGEAGLELVELG